VIELTELALAQTQRAGLDSLDAQTRTLLGRLVTKLTQSLNIRVSST
jgi:hypothetical protein